MADCYEYGRKGVPQQARCGPEGSRRFRLPDFHDIRHMEVMKLSASRTGRLYPKEMFLVLISLGLSRSQGHGTVGRNMSLKNLVTPPGIDPGTVLLVAQRLNHYATPGPVVNTARNFIFNKTNRRTIFPNLFL